MKLDTIIIPKRKKNISFLMKVEISENDLQ